MKSPLLMRLTLASIARSISLKQRPISFLLTLDTAQISETDKQMRNWIVSLEVNIWEDSIYKSL